MPTEFMQVALAEARAALGTTSPNPAVGAVVVRDGQVVGAGRTQPPPGPHAEVMALRDAGEAARGATLYCTLEPCAHHGRTPPCTDAIVAAGIAAVQYALADPDPRVDGRGHRALTAARLPVAAGDGQAEAAEILAPYLHHRRTGLPLVTVKFAASLDGRIAAASGDSRWVSGSETLAWVHSIRPTLDAIVVGSNTVLIDNPQLTARPAIARGADPEDEVLDPAVHQPLRVVLDSRGRVPPDARICAGIDAGLATLVATTERSDPAWRARIADTGAEVLVLPAHHDRVDLEALIGILGGRGMLSVLFEGGGVTLGGLFDRRLVDRVQAVIAPIVIGAADAPAAIAGRGAYRMADVARLRDVQVGRLGDDTLITGTPVWPQEPHP